MALTKDDIKNIRDALIPDFQQVREEMDEKLDGLENRIDEKFDGIQQQMNNRFLNLFASFPDWSQFVTKEDIAEVKERLTAVEDVAVGISKRFDQDLILMQMQLSLHKEWLQKHDKQFELISMQNKNRSKDS